MDYVVLDTDVASLIFRYRLPGAMAARLANKTWCLTFVTIAEMTQWAALRDWSLRNLGALEILDGRMRHDQCQLGGRADLGPAVRDREAARADTSHQRHLDRRVLPRRGSSAGDAQPQGLRKPRRAPRLDARQPRLAWLNTSHMRLYHQQYLSSDKHPYGYCNHDPNGMTCPIGVGKVAEA